MSRYWLTGICALGWCLLIACGSETVQIERAQDKGGVDEQTSIQPRKSALLTPDNEWSEEELVAIAAFERTIGVLREDRRMVTVLGYCDPVLSEEFLDAVEDAYRLSPPYTGPKPDSIPEVSVRSIKIISDTDATATGGVRWHMRAGNGYGYRLEKADGEWKVVALLWTSTA